MQSMSRKKNWGLLPGYIWNRAFNITKGKTSIATGHARVHGYIFDLKKEKLLWTRTSSVSRRSVS